MSEQSSLKRLEVGDNVVLLTEGHDELEVGQTGTIVGFGNDERTYLEVQFDRDDDPDVTFLLTEDELNRIA